MSVQLPVATPSDGGSSVNEERIQFVLRLFKLNKQRLNRTPTQAVFRRFAKLWRIMIGSESMRVGVTSASAADSAPYDHEAAAEHQPIQQKAG